MWMVFGSCAPWVIGGLASLLVVGLSAGVYSESRGAWDTRCTPIRPGDGTQRELVSQYPSGACPPGHANAPRCGIVPTVYRLLGLSRRLYDKMSCDFLSRWDVKRLLVVSMFLAATSYVNALSSVIAGYRTPHLQILHLSGEVAPGKVTLPDLGHDLIDWAQRWLQGVLPQMQLDCDYNTHVAVYVTLCFIAQHPRRSLILRRCMAVFGYVNLLRSISVLVTSLPDSHPDCQAQFSNSDGAYKSAPMFPKAFFRAWKLCTTPNTFVTCGDMIFSGHTVTAVLMATTVAQYCHFPEMGAGWTKAARPHLVLPLIRGCVYGYTLAIVWSIWITRLHYTLDILIAIFITTNTWHVYHHIAHCRTTEHRGGLCSTFLGSLCIWLEAPDPVDRASS